MESNANPIDPVQRLRDAPRCTATAKRTRKRCQCPSKHGWAVCRMHGAGGGHKAGPSHPQWKHGMRSREWVETRKEINEICREGREIQTMVE